MSQAIKSVFGLHLPRFFQPFGASRHMCSYTKDVSKYIQPSAGTDLLMQNLKNATNTKSVLEMVAMHNKIMNNKHIMQALRSLFTLQKCGNSDYSTKEILGHPNFSKLCRQLKYQAGTIELNETIEALKVVSYVGAPSDSIIIQVLLQLIRHNVNSLSLQQIIFMDFLLSQMKPTTMIEALKIALPIVFEIQLPVKMEYDSASHLADYLFYASKNRLSVDCIEKICGALMRCKSNFDQKIAKSLVWSISDLEGNQSYEPVFKKALDSFTVHLDEVSYNDMETTLSKLTLKYSKKCSYFYDEVFFDSCANYVIDKDLGFKHSIYVLRKFARINHASSSLLDYMARKVYENPETVTKGDVVDIYSIVTAVALTDYRPPHWDIIKALIAETHNLTDIDRREIIWIKFAASLCLLDIYRLDVLNKCLTEIFLNNIFRRRFMSDFEYLVTVCTSIKMYKPELACLVPSRYSPEVLLKIFNPPREFPLESALHKALGGDKYVKTGLFSKWGYPIDHVVVFRKGGYPVAMNYPDIQFVEDLEVLSDNYLVILQGLDHLRYTLNNRQMKCSTGLFIKSLEAKGYHVVPVCLEVWENLPDFEKIPYIMQKIKEKTINELTMSENVI